MPSKIICNQGHHAGFSKREAAICLSRNVPLVACGQCDEAVHFYVEHTYANDAAALPQQHRFEVVRVARLEKRAGQSEKYDPFLLLLRDVRTGEEQIWPVFWAAGKKGNWLWGQFSPLLTRAEWSDLFSQLEI